MHKATAILLVLLTIALVPDRSAAQEDGMTEEEYAEMADSPKNQAGVSFSAAIPQGDFSDALNDRTAYGIDLSYSRLLPVGSPLYLGVDVDIAQYGSEEFSSGLTVGGASATLENDQFLVQPQISVRYQPLVGEFFRPFVEGLVGVNVLQSSNRVLVGGEEVDVDGVDGETSTTFSTGIGAGVDIRFLGLRNLGVLGLTLSGQLIYGGEADVTTSIDGLETEPVNEFESEVTGVDRTVVESATTVFQPEVGLYFEF
jgi:hypothetical protein